MEVAQFWVCHWEEKIKQLTSSHPISLNETNAQVDCHFGFFSGCKTVARGGCMVLDHKTHVKKINPWATPALHGSLHSQQPQKSTAQVVCHFGK